MINPLKRLANFTKAAPPTATVAEDSTAIAIQRVEALLQQGQFSEAVTFCQAEIAKMSDNPWLYYNLGKAYSGQQEWVQATAAFNHALQQDANICWFHYHLGESLLRDAQPDRAIAAFESSIGLKPDFAWAHGLLGAAFLDKEQYAQAAQSFQTAVSLEPHSWLQQKLEYAQHLNAGKRLDILTLLKHPPQLHESNGKPIFLGVSTAMANFLAQTVKPGDRTLETGGGLSTLVMLMQGAHHDCIIPDPALSERLKQFCQKHDISTEHLTFHLDRSEIVLPRLKPEPLDLVLIDGRHAFPSPFIDWYYTTDHLKIGGTVIVDDTHLWTGEVLKNFLKQEAEWQLKAEFPTEQPTSAAFVKVRSGSHDKWWAQQPYAVAQAPVPPHVVK
jgi:tetratricopeptide (TPR) repeat protein